MWESIANVLLKRQKILLICCGGYLLWIGYWALQVELSFEMNNTLPASDTAQIRFIEFKKTFGNDHLNLAIGLESSGLHHLPNFLAYQSFAQSLKQIKGIDEVLSIADAPHLVKDLEKKRFRLQPLFSPPPKTEAALDSLFGELKRQRFYRGQLFTDSATLMVIQLRKSVFDSKERYQLVENIIDQGTDFSKKTDIHLHYSGLPYLRYMGSTAVRNEIHIFTALALLLTLAVFYVIFRSFKVVLPCVLLVAIMGFSVLGTIALLGYKITLLTAVIPPIIIIISMTNCVYLVNKYHQSYTQQQDKDKALRQTISQIGQVSFITNLTTAIGFMVLILVQVVILQEFGIIAGLNIMITFVLTMALLPTFLSLLPSPTPKQTRHVESPYMRRLLRELYRFVYGRKWLILGTGLTLTAVAVYGSSLLQANSYMHDDISSAEAVAEDLYFFEKHFDGLMPLEVVVNTGQKKGFLKRETQYKIEELEMYLAELPLVSESLSFNRFLKAVRQAYYNNEPSFYGLPNARDRALVMRYLLNIEGKNTDLYKTFVDSTEQQLRISLRVADMGSAALSSLADSVQQKVDSLFSDSDKLQAHLTGTTLLFIKGNRFLMENLLQTLGIAFVLIAITMALLFRRLRIVWASLLINVVPLLVVAGAMGFAGVAIKPSTALIFSISFGIAVDNSIHFLAKYRIALQEQGYTLLALRSTLTQIGSSMIYTVLILLTGFFIFTFSSFGGTKALGILTIITLGLALLSSLLLLPALLLTIEERQPRVRRKSKQIHSGTKM